MEIAHAAKFVIITTEEIVPDEVIEKDPAQTKIPYFTVDAVVEVPYGSHPNQVPGLYSFDEAHWQEWLDASVREETTQAYLEEYVYSSNDFYDYLEKIGGIHVLHELEKIEKKLVNYPKVAKRRGE